MESEDINFKLRITRNFDETDRIDENFGYVETRFQRRRRDRGILSFNLEKEKGEENKLPFASKKRKEDLPRGW